MSTHIKCAGSVEEKAKQQGSEKASRQVQRVKWLLGEEERFCGQRVVCVQLSLPCLYPVCGYKGILSCPRISLTTVLVTTWEIILRDKPSCTRAYRRDTNETRAINCSDETISWDSRLDQNPALQIDPVAITHDGYYRCEVVTTHGHFYHGYHLTVLVPPEVTLFQLENGTIVCREAAGKPAAQISWTPGGDCHTVEEPLGNDTVTVQSSCVQSSCRWEDHRVSKVSCSVEFC
ncbi:LOW QUALITY PROTEIN: cell surface glycoprotein CD200 receptor 1-like [Prionailurus viverrinus]|uniref:LOW QUALITY PROTEIN: cell surface glycoprotein CD200 receptor 1-like n=1 Tax=Prionailurus viverrinus TaxID=61388 RepID=UPI001FF55B76|nr:LOW QUALITY PROTEIN: cell surface glycoprotein CD200 receptor 1-like [Prionailurus viverrinus]